jgi:hypothetical protein
MLQYIAELYHVNKERKKQMDPCCEINYDAETSVILAEAQKVV